MSSSHPPYTHKSVAVQVRKFMFRGRGKLLPSPLLLLLFSHPPSLLLKLLLELLLTLLLLRVPNPKGAKKALLGGSPKPVIVHSFGFASAIL